MSNSLLDNCFVGPSLRGTMYACYALYQAWRIYAKQDKPASADMMHERVLRECAESWCAGELEKDRE